jgi:heterodisulfide reductase subunit A-like polyferredoxin
MAPNPIIPAADKTTPDAQKSTSTRRVAQLTGHLASPEVSKLQIDASHSIDQVRELKVAVIGAGLSGINAGILLPAKVPGIKLTIFEKNNDVVSIPGFIPTVSNIY